MTRNHRHSACWLLLTTSEILPSFHLGELPANSFYSKILPITLTRSRFCGHYCKTTEHFKDFTGIPGEGVPGRLHRNVCRAAEPKMIAKCYQAANRRCPQGSTKSSLSALMDKMGTKPEGRAMTAQDEGRNDGSPGLPPQKRPSPSGTVYHCPKQAMSCPPPSHAFRIQSESSTGFCGNAQGIHSLLRLYRLRPDRRPRTLF